MKITNEELLNLVLSSNEKFLCNTCIEKNGQIPFEAIYQDTGVCENCNQTNEVTKVQAAEILRQNNINLTSEENLAVRSLFFKEIRRHLRH